MNRIQVVLDAATGKVKEVELSEEEVAEFENERIQLEWKSLREHRDILLQKSDFMVLPDKWERMTSEKRIQWSDYRQALRDLPTNTEDPRQIIWPQEPSKE